MKSKKCVCPLCSLCHALVATERSSLPLETELTEPTKPDVVHKKLLETLKLCFFSFALDTELTELNVVLNPFKSPL